MYQLHAQGIHLPGAAELFADTDNTTISENTSIAPYRIVSMLCLYCIWLTNYENMPLILLHSMFLFLLVLHCIYSQSRILHSN